MDESRLTIKSWAEQDRPREKLLLKGRTVLSDAELIAILIGSGNSEQTAVELSQHILNACENNLTTLSRLSVKDLEKFKGIGEAKAISIIAALELGRRRREVDSPLRAKITSSQSAYELLRGDLSDLGHEEFWMILLKRNNEVIKKERISSGGVSGTVVDTKIVFKRALEHSSSGIIIAHNHPSGNLEPSHEDIRLTKRIKEAGKALDIAVLDHLIITDHHFYSFADNDTL